MRGRLLSFEGGEGAGKTTVIEAAVDHLQQAGIEVVRTREPGGTPTGEAIRSLLLDPSQSGLAAETELLLMFASRAQLVHEQVEPALARGAWVLSDRFTDASFAYQGAGRGLPTGVIAELERWAVGLCPDLTVLLDLPVAVGLERAQRRGEPDRIEGEPPSFFERVRGGYLERARSDPQRFRIVDASQPPAAVIAAVLDAIAPLLSPERAT